MMADTTYEEFLEQWDNPLTDTIMAHTSGSTGTPKSILLPKKLLRESALRTIRFFNLNSESKLRSCISPKFIGGKMMAVRARMCGATFTWEKPSNQPQLPEAYSLISVVPSQMWHILSLPNAVNSSFLIGGSSIPDTLRNAIADKGLDCWESYGMTETASHIALRKVERTPGQFYPLPGIKIHTGPEQNLCINLGEDYEELSTNDIVRIYPDGGFDILGRTDNVIISGGLKIIPEDVERRLHEPLAGLGISTFMISGIKDSKWGECPELIIERGEGTDDWDVERIIEAARNVLQRHEIPQRVEFIDKLPTTANGKILRRKN